MTASDEAFQNAEFHASEMALTTMEIARFARSDVTEQHPTPLMSVETPKHSASVV